MIEIFLSIIISVLLSCAMAILVVVSLNKKKAESDEEAASSIDELKREIAALRNRIVDLENNKNQGMMAIILVMPKTQMIMMPSH
jgi:flagellar basal body-associated protein FliL